MSVCPGLGDTAVRKAGNAAIPEIKSEAAPCSSPMLLLEEADPHSREQVRREAGDGTIS